MKKLKILGEHQFYIKSAEEERLFLLYAKDEDVVRFLMFHPITDSSAIDLLYKRSQAIIDFFEEFHPNYARVSRPTTEVDEIRYKQWLNAVLYVSPLSFDSDSKYYDYVESIHFIGEKKRSYTFGDFKSMVENKDWKSVRNVLKDRRVSKPCRTLLIENPDPATLLFFIKCQKFIDDDEQMAFLDTLANYQDTVLGSYIIWRYCSYWSLGEKARELIKNSENELLIELVKERNA